MVPSLFIPLRTLERSNFCNFAFMKTQGIDYKAEAVDLLRKIIATPSVSRNEKEAADLMEQALTSYGFECKREANNVWAFGTRYVESRPTLLLNAHIDTVKR